MSHRSPSPFSRGVVQLVAAAAFLAHVHAAAAAALPPRQIDSYPRNEATYVPPQAELYFVFDQPTSKRGSFSVADLDSAGQPLLNLDVPRWSALGDTVFLKPLAPMSYGHFHGMRVNTIVGPPPDSAIGSDLPIVNFTIFPRSRLERVVGQDRLESFTLVPDRPTPVGVSVRETAGNAAEFTSARVELWAGPEVPISGPVEFLPTRTLTVPISARVPRLGAARLEVPVTVPRDLARLSPGGRIGLRILFQGVDETGLPVTFEGLSRTVTTVFGDTTLVMSPALLTPPIAGNVSLESAVLEWPLPGAVFSAGDTLRPRAVVTGIGTGPFRAAFYLDGDLVALEEGFMESGRPVTVEMRGPLPTRRLGERRLQFAVEAPQSLAAAPITFLCVPPVHGVSPAAGDVGPVPDPAAPPPRITLESTWMADARSRFREQDASATGWAAWRARADLSPTRRLEAQLTSRVRLDDAENGSASPEQISLRYTHDRATLEWGDLAPSIAAGSPMLAAPVPRRAAQAAWSHARLGELRGYVALEAHPRSSGGAAREIRSDLYAGQLTRGFGRDRVRAALYGGYTHEDPTPGGVETATRTRAIYGGSAAVRLAGSWEFSGDAATVRHRAIAGVETGRTRTGMRGEMAGRAAGFAARTEVFRYQPDLATALNPYAISDRRGVSVDLSRVVATWRLFGGYRRESPAEESAGAPSVTAERITLGGSLRLNPDAWVTPALVRIRQKGPQSDFTQTRVATEFTVGEPMDGRTTARFDIAHYNDERGLNTKRLVTSGSVVSVRRHPGRLSTTLAAGIEQDENEDLDLRDRTIQGSFELRWEAVAGTFLVSPFVTYVTRDLELRGAREDRLSVRLQLSLLRLPSFSETVLSIQGRFDRISIREPSGDDDDEIGVELSIGRSVPLIP